MKIGDEFQLWMEGQVPLCRRVLLVVTNAWLKSQWAGHEQLLASRSDPLNRSRRIIPVVAEPGCQPPQRVSGFLYADVTDPTESETQWEKLIASLREEEGAPPSEPDPGPPASEASTSVRRGLEDLKQLLGVADVKATVEDYKASFRSASTRWRVRRVQGAPRQVPRRAGQTADRRHVAAVRPRRLFPVGDAL